MTDNIRIRSSRPDDVRAIEALTRNAFPDEDLVPLVHELLQGPTPVIVLVGELRGRISGYVIFTVCSVEGSAARLALLAPLAVAPETQQQGIGSTIVRTGLEMLAKDGFAHVFVLGDPVYYHRFGFETESGVMPPYALPPEWTGAWQSIALAGDAKPLTGTLTVPDPWLHEALWAPASEAG